MLPLHHCPSPIFYTSSSNFFSTISFIEGSEINVESYQSDRIIDLPIGVGRNKRHSWRKFRSCPPFGTWTWWCPPQKRKWHPCCWPRSRSLVDKDRWSWDLGWNCNHTAKNGGHCCEDFVKRTVFRALTSEWFVQSSQWEGEKGGMGRRGTIRVRALCFVPHNYISLICITWICTTQNILIFLGNKSQGHILAIWLSSVGRFNYRVKA